MNTLEISLDGYTDLPPGKIANVVTYLEMVAPPAAARGRTGRTSSFRQRRRARRRLVPRDDPRDRRGLAVVLAAGDAGGGARRRSSATRRSRSMRWSGPARPSASPNSTGASTARSRSRSSGSAPSEIGTGAARWLMDRTPCCCLRAGPRRVWLHTCTFDHPAAVPFYLRAGFRPFKFAIEVMRRSAAHGASSRDGAAPHVALIRPRHEGRRLVAEAGALSAPPRSARRSRWRRGPGRARRGPRSSQGPARPRCIPRRRRRAGP